MNKYSVKVQTGPDSFDFITVRAESEREAAESASLRGYSVIETELKIEKNYLSFNLGKVPAGELYHFTRLFATLTRAGIPLLETIEMLAKRAENTKLKQALTAINKDIEEGQGLTVSFSRHEGIFDKTYLQLIEVGEESGNLPQVLDRLTQLLRKKIKLRGMIIKALTYPVLVMVLSLIVVAAILIKIVPRFKEIYSKFGGDLPAMTRITLDCSDLLINYFPLFVIGLILLFTGLWLGKKTLWGKTLYDRFVLSLPLLGPMFHTYEIAGFAKSFSMLVHSG
ncbi:MAG: type II secretion system F family protein, partial [Candidatus Rifleibacteriota bacterium]